jgi:hypothetical protein
MTSNDSYSDTDLRNVIEDEGLDYAVRFYLSEKDIKSEETRQLWQTARVALEKLAAHLELED